MAIATPATSVATVGASTILDWGDCGVGHPLLDLPGFLDRTPEPDRDIERAHWLRTWREAVPGSDPDRAAIGIAPIAAARQAVIYQRFLDGIEVAEHPYHQADVPDWLHGRPSWPRSHEPIRISWQTEHHATTSTGRLGGAVRARGTQSRNATASTAGPATGTATVAAFASSGDPGVSPVPGPRVRTPRSSAPKGGGGGGAGYWPVVAIIAIVVATAGWTTVAVMALTDRPAAAAAETPDPGIEDPNATSDDTEADFSDAPEVEPHDAPELEALLPNIVDDTPMTFQSGSGDTLQSNGESWAAAMTTYVTSVGKTFADLSAAVAFDPNQENDTSVGVFRLEGVPGESLRTALQGAWKDEFPDMVTSTIKIDGADILKGDFGEGAINSYWLVKDGLVFDIETADEAVATKIITGLRHGTLPLGPTATDAPESSGSAGGSSSPAASPSPS